MIHYTLKLFLQQRGRRNGDLTKETYKEEAKLLKGEVNQRISYKFSDGGSSTKWPEFLRMEGKGSENGVEERQ